jgi:hypothetical protein
VLSFFAYLSASLTFATAQNRLFVVYLATLTVAVFALVLVVLTLDPEAVREAFPPRPSRTTLAAYLIAVAVALSLAWVPDLVSWTVRTDTARLVGPYTSMVTHALDLGLVVPVVCLTAVLLLRRAPAGYLLSVLILVLNVCIGVMLLGAGLAQLLADVPLTPGEIIAKMLSFAVLTLVAGGLLATLYRSARARQRLAPAQPAAPAPSAPGAQQDPGGPATGSRRRDDHGNGVTTAPAER